MIAPASGQPSGVLTTDFFGFDTSNNFYKLKGKGSLCEMGDAVLGLVVKQMDNKALRWVAVRNVSDPQIKAEGTSKIRETSPHRSTRDMGRWSNICSASVCWALVAAEK